MVIDPLTWIEGSFAGSCQLVGLALVLWLSPSRINSRRLIAFFIYEVLHIYAQIFTFC